MAYSGPTPVATLDEMLQALVTWAVVNAGFSGIGAVVPPTGATTDFMYYISKDGFYWYFYGGMQLIGGVNDGFIGFRAQTAVPSATNYNSPTYGPNQVTRAQVWRNISGPYTNYNFFTDGNSVHVVLEVSTNVFSHFSFGKVVKFGTWTGGEYTTAWYSTSWSDYPPVGYGFSNGTVPFEGGSNNSAYSGFVRYPYDPHGDYRDWAKIGSSEVDNQLARFMTLGSVSPSVYNSVLSGPLFWCGANSINQRAAMVPQYLQLHHEGMNSLFLAGYVDHVKFLNMEVITPKDIVETEWEVFPLIQKSGDMTVAPVTENLALAYRRA
jgi:hypothetical protein